MSVTWHRTEAMPRGQSRRNGYTGQPNFGFPWMQGMNTFEGQAAVVTGATSGIGRAIALALARLGAVVHALGRREAALRELSGIYPATIVPHGIDIGSAEAVAGFVRGLRQGSQGVDILVHSAGVFYMGPLQEGVLDEFEEMLRVNLLGPYLLTRGLLEPLRAARGQIVFINSSAGLKARGGVAQYAATKAGLKAMADGLREEVNADGVRVLSVFPGRTDSAMQARIHELEGKAYDPSSLMSPEDVAGIVTDTLGLGRSAEVTDLSIRPMNKLA